MSASKSRVSALALLLTLTGLPGVQAGSKEADAALLKRIYQARIQLEREQAQNDNGARANVRLQGNAAPAGADAPTVSRMRQETYTRLSRFEQNFRCLDVDVNNNGGNTVVICGANSGDIEGENTTVGRDLLNVTPAPTGARP